MSPGDKIPIEIERRWILKSNPDLHKIPDQAYRIYQMYRDDGWRYREQREIDPISYNVDEPIEITYYKTKKTDISEGVCEEEQYEIDQYQYENPDGDYLKGISKIRLVYKINGLKFEVDLFTQITLIIMEVELDAIDQEFEMPEFLQKLIVCEITGMKEFSNSSLSELCK